MEKRRYGNVELRFFYNNESVYVMYNDYKLFVKREDINDFILALKFARRDSSSDERFGV